VFPSEKDIYIRDEEKEFAIYILLYYYFLVSKAGAHNCIGLTLWIIFL
jgi:hypothetical protein